MANPIQGNSFSKANITGNISYLQKAGNTIKFKFNGSSFTISANPQTIQKLAPNDKLTNFLKLTMSTLDNVGTLSTMKDGEEVKIDEKRVQYNSSQPLTPHKWQRDTSKSHKHRPNDKTISTEEKVTHTFSKLFNGNSSGSKIPYLQSNDTNTTSTTPSPNNKKKKKKKKHKEQTTTPPQSPIINNNNNLGGNNAQQQNNQGFFHCGGMPSPYGVPIPQHQYSSSYPFTPPMPQSNYYGMQPHYTFPPTMHAPLQQQYIPPSSMQNTINGTYSYGQLQNQSYSINQQGITFPYGNPYANIYNNVYVPQPMTPPTQPPNNKNYTKDSQTQTNCTTIDNKFNQEDLEIAITKDPQPLTITKVKNPKTEQKPPLTITKVNAM